MCTVLLPGSQSTSTVSCGKYVRMIPCTAVKLMEVSQRASAPVASEAQEHVSISGSIYEEDL